MGCVETFCVLFNHRVFFWVGENCVFRPLENSTAQTPYRWKFVSIRHSDPRPRRCAGTGMRDAINNFGGSRSVLITRWSWHEHDWLYGSLLMTLIAHFSVRAYMYVTRSIIACSVCDSWAYKNDACTELWANSGIRRGSCWKYRSGWRDMFRLFQVIRTTVGHHFNWYRASRGSDDDSWASCLPWS